MLLHKYQAIKNTYASFLKNKLSKSSYEIFYNDTVF